MFRSLVGLVQKPGFGLRLLSAQAVGTPNTANLPTLGPASAKLYQETSEPDSLLRRLEIEIRGHDTAVLSSYEKFVRIVCEELNLNLVSV